MAKNAEVYLLCLGCIYTATVDQRGNGDVFERHIHHLASP